MTLQEFISVLEGRGLKSRREGRDHRALCPAHNDEGGRPSLTVCEGEGGIILLKCWSGCETERIVAALGLTMKDLFADNGNGQGTQHPDSRPKAKPKTIYASVEAAGSSIGKRLRGRFTQHWTYGKRDATEAFVVLRFDGCKTLTDEKKKTYRPIHHNGTGYVEGDPDGLLPLYRLPELLRDASSLVFLPEGEKCVESARSIGLCATTSAHGAKSADKTNFGPLAGRSVAILPDNDANGRKYMEDVRDILLGLDPPATVRIVTLPELPEHGDIADWLDQRDSSEPDALRTQIVALAEKVKPEARASGRNPADSTRATQYVGMIVRVQRQAMKRVRWLVPGHLALGKLGILVGLPSCGKSLFVTWLVAAMQRRDRLPDIAGEPVDVAQGASLLVTCEDDPQDTIAPRLAAYGVDPASLAIYKGTRIVEADGTESVCLFDLSLHLPAVEAFLTSSPETKLVAIDPVQTFLGKTDLNGNTQINVALGGLAELAQRHAVAVLLVSHFNKKSDQAALDRIIGSRGFSGTVRSAWMVSRDREQNGRCILACMKQQNGPWPPAMAYRIREIALEIEGETQGVPIIEFESDRIDVDPDELVNPTRRKADSGQIDECAMWIKERLAAGPALSATIIEEAKTQGFSRKLCFEAKDRLKIKAKPAGFQGAWFWSLRGEK